MLPKRRSIPVLLFVLVLAIQSTLVPTTAFAASDYDNVIATGGEFELYLPVNNEGMGRCSEPYLMKPKSNDLGLTWAGYLLDPANYTNPTVGAEGVAFWQDLLDNSSPGEGYGWSVSQYTAPSTNPPAGYKTIIITASTTRGAEFTTAYGYKVLRTIGTNTRTYYIDYYSYGNPNIRCDVHVGYWNNYGRVIIANEGNASVEKSIFVNYDIDYPDDYKGEVPPSTYTPPPAKYVAMGDSFSSGEGNPPFEGWTDISGVNECHRSFRAYPPLLQSSSSLELGPMDFVACSGATTNNVLNGQWNEPAQVDALSSDTEVATITIGGNDVGFKDFATACFYGTCAIGTTAYNDAVGKIQTELVDNNYLAGVYEFILDQMTKSGSQLYVVGYPLLTPSSVLPANLVCPYMTPDLENGVGDDAAGAYSVITQLNGAIEDSVDLVDGYEEYSGRIHFVDPTEGGSPFEGHDICNYGSYFIGADPFSAGPFHPNENGQQAYADLIESYMS